MIENADADIQKAAKAQVAGKDAERQQLTRQKVLELYDTFGVARTGKADAAKREQIIDLVTGAIAETANDQLKNGRDGLYLGAAGRGTLHGCGAALAGPHPLDHGHRGRGVLCAHRGPK